MKKEICPKCKLEFGLTEVFMLIRRLDGDIFHCPQGHQQSYGTSEEGKVRIIKNLLSLRDDLENEKDRYESLRTYHGSVNEEFRLTRLSLSATKGVVTKLKKRLAEAEKDSGK